jgi:hypothetical protein
MYLLSLRRVMSFLIVFGVIWTGKATDKGHKWAAGNRAYTRIRDRQERVNAKAIYYVVTYAIPFDTL